PISAPPSAATCYAAYPIDTYTASQAPPIIEQAHTHITHGELNVLFYKKNVLRLGEQLTLRLRDRKDKTHISDAYESISYSRESSLFFLQPVVFPYKLLPYFVSSSSMISTFSWIMTLDDNGLSGGQRGKVQCICFPVDDFDPLGCLSICRTERKKGHGIGLVEFSKFIFFPSFFLCEALEPVLELTL
ncbi:hypothetical protein STEG23_010211, partial [Scotinomys teguina]